MNPRTPTCKADFVWDRVAYHVVAVIDCNAGNMSVTNDAENVVRLLLERGCALDDDTIVYRDSDGMWDQLCHNGRGFTGFRPLRCSSLIGALRKVWGI